MLRRGLRAAGKIGRAKVANGGNHTMAQPDALRRVVPAGFPAAARSASACAVAGTPASGAAPIAPEVLEFFMGIGIPVFELYGMTENTAIATLNLPGRVKIGTVGEPYPGTELRLDPETNEIQTRHAGTFAGYWGKPDKTAETFTDDGFL